MRSLMRPLRQEEVDLLRDVIAHARAPSTELVMAVQTNRLTAEQRAELCALIGLELVRTGLGPGSEPNARGAELEALLDAINPGGSRR
jgi:hypothetical protein